MRELPAFLEPRAARSGATAAPPARSTGAGAPVPRSRPANVPGEVGLWIFILGDMLMFGAFFAAFMVQRGEDPARFAQGREALDVWAGAANTLILLTSSLLVATAVRAHREGRRAAARRLVALAGVCAAAFAAIKVGEWITKVSDGDDPGANLFFTYYFLLTGVHFLHLTIGSVVLGYWHRLLGRAPQRPEADERRVVESCASYWHMVDLLWLVLFPVLYLAAT